MPADRRDVGNVPIDMLPEELLLEIFDFYMRGVDYKEEWETLVHVCRRWRSVVFSAPLRLDLRLVCTGGTLVKKMLGIWPALPILIWMYWLDDEIEDEVLAALEHKDRICEIYVQGASDHGLKLLAEATQDLFPALTDLRIESFHGVSVVPDSLLRGSAPHLRCLHLMGVEFPALPKLILSTTGLVELSLCDFTDYQNDAPWMMVDCLPSLTGLEKLQLDYRYFPHSPDQASGRPPPLTCIVLPVLTAISFKGRSECLDHFFSRIDAPLLKHVDIMFLYPAVAFEFSKISQFIGRKESFEAFDQAHMWWNDLSVNLTLSSRKGATGGMWLKLSMRCINRVWRLQSLTQVHHPFANPLVTNGHFDGSTPSDGQIPYWATQTGNAQWLEFVRLFAAVESLYLSEIVAWLVAPLLRELSSGESVATARDVLPALHTIFIERLDNPECARVREAIGKFATKRELSDRPVAVHLWEEEEYYD